MSQPDSIITPQAAAPRVTTEETTIVPVQITVIADGPQNPGSFHLDVFVPEEEYRVKGEPGSLILPPGKWIVQFTIMNPEVATFQDTPLLVGPTEPQPAEATDVTFQIQRGGRGSILLSFDFPLGDLRSYGYVLQLWSEHGAPITIDPKVLNRGRPVG